MKKHLFTLATLLFAISNSTFAAFCDTHFTCQLNQACACTVMANSAYDRFFYLDFPQLAKDKQYECQMKSKPTTAVLRLDLSTFPTGASYACKENCSNFPVQFTVNTEQMTAKNTTMVIKYFIAASDYLSDITASCKTIN